MRLQTGYGYVRVAGGRVTAVGDFRSLKVTVPDRKALLVLNGKETRAAVSGGRLVFTAE
jgi:hypothetical protein